MSCGIYKFENNINHMIYIGQAIDLKERYNKHCKNINDKTHTEDFYKGLREFGLENFSYEILEEFETFDQDKLNELECYYIKKFNSLKPNGYNMVPGGTNGAGLAKGKKVQQFDLKGNFICEYPSAHQAEIFTGINYSSICACCRKEIQHTKNFQWKYKNSDKIITDISDNGIIINEKKVYQYDLQGNLLNIYSTLKEASELTKISKSLICKVCCFKGNTAGGYVWRYEGSNFNEHKTIPKQRIVEQYDKNLILLNTFNSLTEAAKQTGCNCANISSVCSGKRKTANGYIWKYKID